MVSPLMVPIEVRAFRLLAICLVLLVVALLVQLFPRRAPGADRLVSLVILAVVLIMAVMVLMLTTY